jgi:thiol-disulfide isomerase/thioredoxin
MRRSTLVLALAGLALIVIAIIAWLALPRVALVTPAGDDDCAPALEADGPAAELALEQLSGGQLTIQDLAGDVLLLNTWATWCPPCRKELPALEAVYRRYRQQGLIVLGVNIGESREIVERFVTRSGLTFPILLDPDEASLPAFGTISLPSSFLIDRQGNVRARWIGATCERELDEAILPVLGN